MTYAPPSKTWGDVAATVRRSFGDESGVQMEDGDLVRWINQGQYEICRQNKVLKAKGTTVAMPGQPSYSLDLGRPVLQVESVRLGDRRLVPTEFTTIDANLEEYPASAAGDPSLWYRWGEEITLWPTPKASAELTIFFTAAPEPETSLEPDRKLAIPDDYFLPLVDYCMSRAHEMDDNLQGQEVSSKLYADRLASMNTESRSGQGLTFQKITIVD